MSHSWLPIHVAISVPLQMRSFVTCHRGPRYRLFPNRALQPFCHYSTFSFWFNLSFVISIRLESHFQTFLYLDLPLLALCFGQFLHSPSSSNSSNTLSVQFNSMPIPANQGTAAGAGGIIYGNEAFGNPKRE
jgi:hypothetical protein